MSIQLPNPEEDYYYDLSLRDGRVIPVAPKVVDAVQKLIDAQHPIPSPAGSIPVEDVTEFKKTNRRYTDFRIQEDAARALKETLLNHEGDVKARWVKKEVGRSEYDKYYAKSHAYRHLYDTSDGVMVAFTVPAHLVDTEKVRYCTDEEEQNLR